MKSASLAETSDASHAGFASCPAWDAPLVSPPSLWASPCYAGLCLQETDPLNPEAWVKQNVVPGGQVFAEGTELSFYGTKEERTLEVVAMGFAAD